MSLIEIDIEFVTQVLIQLDQLRATLEEDINAVDSAYNQAYADWQGLSFQSFQEWYGEFRAVHDLAVQEAQDLTQWIRQEIASFEQSDASAPRF